MVGLSGPLLIIHYTVSYEWAGYSFWLTSRHPLCFPIPFSFFVLFSHSFFFSFSIRQWYSLIIVVFILFIILIEAVILWQEHWVFSHGLCCNSLINFIQWIDKLLSSLFIKIKIKIKISQKIIIIDVSELLRIWPDDKYIWSSIHDAPTTFQPEPRRELNARSFPKGIDQEKKQLLDLKLEWGQAHNWVSWSANPNVIEVWCPKERIKFSIFYCGDRLWVN